MHTFIKSDNKMGFVGLGYQLGASYEPDGMHGISHLLEHLACKPFDQHLPALKRLSITDNAYTSDNKVVFWFSGRERTLLEILPDVFDRLLSVSPIWDEEAFNNEKETVLQEYMDVFNNQESGFYENILRRHYGYYSAIGLKKDIENFTYSQSVALAKSVIPRPSYLAQVGSHKIMNIDLFSDMKTIKLLQFKEEGHGLPEDSYPKSDKTVVGLLGTKPLYVPSSATLANFIMACLNDGLESPMYQEIREHRGLSYFSLGDFTIVGAMAIPIFFATTTNEKAEELKDVYSKFFSGDLTRHITKDRFRDCKEYFLGRKEISFLLPHSGAGPAALKDYDKFEGIENLTYNMVLDGLIDMFNRDSFMPVEG